MVQPWRDHAGEMMLTISITETLALKTLGDFLKSIIGAEIIRTPVNLAAMPKGGFIAMTPKSFNDLSTPINKNTAFNQYITRPAQLVVQLDFYGSSSMDNANIVNASLRDNFAADFFTASGIDLQTLYCGDAIQLPIVSGESQYIERWSMACNLQMNPMIERITQSANSLNINVLNAETFKPQSVATDKYADYFQNYNLNISAALKLGIRSMSQFGEEQAIQKLLQDYNLQIQPLLAP
jgi:hypothetical protein